MLDNIQIRSMLPRELQVKARVRIPEGSLFGAVAGAVARFSDAVRGLRFGQDVKASGGMTKHSAANERIKRDYFAYLKEALGGDDPLFPATEIGLGEQGGFIAAGLLYFNPHSFRDMLTQLGERLCRTPEEFKAWSQNLGHSGVLTTLTSYGSVASHRQAELIRGLGPPAAPAVSLDDPDLAELFHRLAQRGLAWPYRQRSGWASRRPGAS